LGTGGIGQGLEMGKRQMGNRITSSLRKGTKQQTMTATSQWMLQAKMGSRMKGSGATVASG